MNGVLVSSLSQAPYIAPWTGTAGVHTLEVRATDVGGNQASAEIEFELAR